MEYHDFVNGKSLANAFSGFDPVVIHDCLYDFQKAIVEWAVKKGRAAIFADTGLGKTAMQLAWADNVVKHTQGSVLVIAPLCVAQQTVREGEKYGIPVHYCRSQSAIIAGINITNYEMIKDFEIGFFQGVVLDESSILKSYMGKIKRELVEKCSTVKYRLACTATPSPNDHLELGNHAEFLGIMPSNEMISRFFINDSMEAGSYRLKNHARKPFWKWVSSWAMCISKPEDVGFNGKEFILPKLKTNFIPVDTSGLEAPEGELFRIVEMNATSVHKEGRMTAAIRAETIAEKVRLDETSPWLIWCNTNYEADELVKVLPGAVEMRGCDSIDKKEETILGFLEGRIRILITKPSIAGMGLNFQHCNNMAFVGLSFSYEDYYQAIRRCWRFGQKNEVHVFVAYADSESSIIKIIKQKEKRHNEMKKEMVNTISEFHRNQVLEGTPYFGKKHGSKWELHHGDCVHVAKMIEADTIDFSVYSPPFSNLYIYSDSSFDMGNSANDDEFFQHYGFLVKELFRITRPGRLTAIHCKDLPRYKGRDGAAGLYDFPGEIIRLYESHGWQYHSRVTIWKDPVIEMQRTKNHGLLYKQLCKDSAASRQGMADYLIVMRKCGDEEKYDPVTTGGERFFDYVGMTQCRPEGKELAKAKSKKELERLFSISVWQRYASPVWFDIRQTNVLNGRIARADQDEKHICPLQLDVIERCIELWSNPGDLVFSPFTGVGSEGYVALKKNRRFVGAELKESYYELSCDNLARGEFEAGELDLFHNAEIMEEVAAD